ncbi:hypothetical protein CLV98_102103 [Dyadobacter jejuensis]|uniref:Uncharacterized protein n=1 Tax=Dyadobacter jejuensis TaxID=1082580 RepID=A0A316AP46_9BACT|nr:hypothetical protein [Dyadobacter jejuensis]PWJ59271.1 hypothetical protein CLV98_102103 [Dyadobacter jejuensis]
MSENNKTPAASYVKDLLTAGPSNSVLQGLELSVSTILGKTLLRRLPTPLNYAVPFVVEKLIAKHAVPQGRDLLIQALRWVKRATADPVRGY